MLLYNLIISGSLEYYCQSVIQNLGTYIYLSMQSVLDGCMHMESGKLRTRFSDLR